MAAFSRKSSFATVVKFFNIIGLYTSNPQEEPRARTNHIKESYNSCEAAFSAERSQWQDRWFDTTLLNFFTSSLCPPLASNFTHAIDADTSYTEILYAHLLDCDGTRLTYTHFTTKANFGTLVEITFNRPVYIQKHKVYRVGVVFNKAGWYPVGVCAQNMNCDSVFFSFGVGNTAHAIRDGLIRSIVFTYH